MLSHPAAGFHIRVHVYAKGRTDVRAKERREMTRHEREKT